MAVNDAGLLKILETFKELEFVNISDCRGLTKLGVKQVVRSNPQIEFKYTNSNNFKM